MGTDVYKQMVIELRMSATKRSIKFGGGLTKRGKSEIKGMKSLDRRTGSFKSTGENITLSQMRGESVEPFVSRSRANVRERRKHISKRRIRRVQREVVKTKISQIIIIILGARRSASRVNVTIVFKLGIKGWTKKVMKGETVHMRDELWRRGFTR